MTATAYIEENGDFRKVAWSLRASEVRAPSRGLRPSSVGSKQSSGDQAVA